MNWGAMMKNWYSDSTNALCRAFLSLENEEECYAFLEDLCTIKEIIGMAQRLQVAKMLRSGASYTTITRATGASTATISRVSKCCEYGSGGYSTVMERTVQEDET